MHTLFSIITPTFNRAYILATAIQSVLSQTYTNWEMIIVDDGSTDDTQKLVSSFGDKRIKYLYQENKGPSSARNKAFSVVGGEWVCYLDSDNEFLPNYLEIMLTWINKNKTTLYALPKNRWTLELYRNWKLVKRIESAEDFPETVTLEDIFMRKFHFEENGLMHSKKIIGDGIRWDENLLRSEGWEFLMQIGERYPDSFLYVPCTLVNYYQRFGGDSMISNTTYKQFAETFEYIYQKHKNDVQLQGQKWYPQRVEKYMKLEQAFREGIASPPQLRYFVEN